MSASRSVPSQRSAAIPTPTVVAAVLFAVVGALIGIVAFAFVVAAQVAPSELATHPVGEALLRATPLLVAVAIVHLAVAVGLLTGARVARPAAAFVSLFGAALAVAEAAAIVAGRDPLAAESTDPARAAQSGMQIVLVMAVAYAAMLALSLRARQR